MSRPIAFPPPLRRASSAAPTAPPAGPDKTLPRSRSPGLRAWATRPPEERISSGSGRPSSAALVTAGVQIAASSGAPGRHCHDRGGAALVLTKLRRRFVRGRDVHIGKGGAQALCDLVCMRDVDVGDPQAHGPRLDPGSRRRRRRRRWGPRRRPAARRLRPGQPAPTRRGRPGRAAPVWACRGGRAGDGSPAADHEQVGEAGGGDQGRVGAAAGSSSALVPTVMPWASDSTSPAPAPACRRAASTAVSTPPDWSPGHRRRLRRVEEMAVEDTSMVNVPRRRRRTAVVEPGAGFHSAMTSSSSTLGEHRTCPGCACPKGCRPFPAGERVGTASPAGVRVALTWDAVEDRALWQSKRCSSASSMLVSITRQTCSWSPIAKFQRTSQNSERAGGAEIAAITGDASIVTSQASRTLTLFSPVSGSAVSSMTSGASSLKIERLKRYMSLVPPW